MNSLVMIKCDNIINEVNNTLYKNFKKSIFTIEYKCDGFDVCIGNFTICHISDICINPELVEISISNKLKKELDMDKDESIICNSSTIHLMLKSIICTEFVTDIVYDYIKEDI